jgi:transcriptional regulator with XRE-family HTH domain
MNLEKIGKFIASARKKKNLTQEQLAIKLGINNRTISRWENGKNMPDASLYKPLCEILEISIEELINGEKTNKNEIRESVEKAIINTVDLSEKTRNKMNKQIKIFIFLILLILFFATITLIYCKKKYPIIDIYGLDILPSEKNILNENITLDIEDFKIWFFGVDSLQLIDKDNNHFDLKSALKYRQVKIQDIERYLEFQVNNCTIEKYTLFDGGTKIYKTKKYEVIFCNTLDGNKDIYFGTVNIENNLNGKYCGYSENDICYFIRTYHILNITETDENEFVDITVEDYNGMVDIVRVNNTNNIKVGKNYEFTFNTEKKYEDNIKNIFENSTLIAVEETSKDINNQINEKICVNDY